MELQFVVSVNGVRHRHPAAEEGAGGYYDYFFIL